MRTSENSKIRGEREERKNLDQATEDRPNIMKQTYDESLEWSTQPDLNRELCLFDLDETIVEYN